MSEPSVLHVNSEKGWRGGEQQTLYLLDGLRERGITNLLVAREGGEMAERARAAGHEVVETSMRGEADLSVPKLIRTLVKERGINLLHAHTSHGHVYIQVAAATLSKALRPKVLVHRRVDFSIYRRSFLKLSGLKYKFGVDRYITVSRAIREVLIKDGLDPAGISVVHSGIDLARIDDAPDQRDALRAEWQVPEGAPLIANVAAFADHKGQVYLIEAMPAIIAAHPEARCAIVGDGELREPLMERARELGVFDNMIFPGFRTDVPSILKAIDVFVMPSHMEGLGTSVLDAMAARRAVVGTEAGGMPEMFEPGVNAMQCPIRDSGAIAEAVIPLLCDPERRRAMGEAARATVEAGFSTQAMVEGNLAVYRELLGA